MRIEYPSCESTSISEMETTNQDINYTIREVGGSYE